MLNIVAARSHHLLGRTVVQSPHCLSKKIKFVGGNHVANLRDIVKHPSPMLIVEALVLHLKHGDAKNLPDVLMEEYFKLVGQGFSHRPSFTSPQE